MKKEQLLNNIGFGVIVVLLLVILVFQKNVKVVLYAISLIGVVYGLMNIPKKGASGFIFICLGISLAISGTLYFIKYFDLKQTFTLMIAASVFLLMIITLVFTYLRKKMLDENYSLRVNATVTDLISSDNTNSKFYQPCYKYTIDGHEYSVLFPGFISKRIPKIGDVVQIRVDKDDYQNVYFDKSFTERLFDLILVVFLLIVSLVIGVLQFL